MSGIKIEFTDKELSPWDGMVLMKRLIEKSGINEQLRKMDLPEQGSNQGYDRPAGQ